MNSSAVAKPASKLPSVQPTNFELAGITQDFLHVYTTTSREMAHDSMMMIAETFNSQAKNVGVMGSDFIPSGIGELFPQLQFLFLHAIKQKSLQRKSFKHMQQLTTLNLDCPAREIQEETFWDLPRLRSLYMGRTELTRLPRNLFKKNLQIESIELNQANLKKIDVDFTKLPKLATLIIQGAGSCFNIDGPVTEFAIQAISQNCSM
jgi:Leucine rich repeat